MSAALLGFIECLGSSATSEDYEALYQKSIEDLGFQTFTYVNMLAAESGESSPVVFGDKSVIGTTVPKAWREHYRAHEFFRRDPAIAACRRQVTPVHWDSLLFGDGHAPSETRVIHEAKEFGLRQGISIPVHGPRGKLAIFSISSDQSEGEFKGSVDANLHSLHLMSIHYHASIHQNIFDKDLPEEEVELTPREIECMRWTAQGKSSWEVSVILSITERTVNFHLGNAMRKMNVYNKTHAVAKMLSMGMAQL